MPKDTETANISRRRLKEQRPSQIKYTKRTRGQLAHLEELVEEKKPGSLGGSSFGVFELEDAVPQPENTIVKRGGFVNHNQQHRFQFEYAANGSDNIPAVDTSVSNKNVTSIVNPLPEELDSMAPNINKDSMQSLYSLRPYADPHTAEPAATSSNQPAFLDLHQCMQGEIYGLETFSQKTVPVPSAPSAPPLACSIQSPSLPKTWQLASHSLVQGPKGSRLAQLEDVLSEDILVRAIVWGWDSIGERWELPPFWQIIRQLDESMFFLFGPIERMGIFRIVHLLMRYHADPTPERAATIPPFYSK